ncbi:hypothetical protein DFH07DRAFT_944654 [Mycena maculata]|uniref:Uncharacterized protein n=1 Tax=Mycena maculata TaxID=230809 RepID=A0AAD7MVP6_9AGAR|nr:hypothetical protein DFH07DRAFT_944654 [Mycena maculata]
MAPATNSTIPNAELRSFVANTFAPVLYGLVIQQMLLGTLFSQAWYYYSHHIRTGDSRFYPYLVGVGVFLNLCESGIDLVMVWRLQQNEQISSQTWILWATETAITVVIVLLAQLFFIHRFWSMAMNLKKARPLLGWLLPMPLLCFGLGVAYSISYTEAKPFSYIPDFITAWLVAVVVTDLITHSFLMLAIALRKLSIDQPHEMKQLNGDTVAALSKTCFTSIVDVFPLVLFFMYPGSTYYLAFQMSISGVYMIVVLSTLLNRVRPDLSTERLTVWEILEICVGGPRPRRRDSSSQTAMREQDGVTITTVVECDIDHGFPPRLEPESQANSTF